MPIRAELLEFLKRLVVSLHIIPHDSLCKMATANTDVWAFAKLASFHCERSGENGKKEKRGEWDHGETLQEGLCEESSTCRNDQEQGHFWLIILPYDLILPESETASSLSTRHNSSVSMWHNWLFLPDEQTKL